jgi:threonine dehydrogenase-like Zn-dependent dehydrogenase
MRALVLNSQLQFNANYSKPPLQHGEALIRVIQAGICSTDLQILKGYMTFEGVMGHEFVGIIEEAYNRNDLIGKRVAGEINASCRACPTCRAGNPTHCPHRTTLGIFQRDGAFADYLTLPLENLHVLPEDLTNEEAVFIEPLAAACEIPAQISIRPTDYVVVIGDGKLGILCAQVLQLLGCRLVVLGHHQEKLNILKKRNIAISTDPNSLEPGADFIIEATGTPSGISMAEKLVRPRGTIVLKSTYHGNTTVCLTNYVIHEINLIGSRCGPFAPAIRLLQQRLVDVRPLIHATFPLEQGLKAFEVAKKSPTLKVLFEMGN